MENQKNLRIVLFLTRVSVFVVFLVWSVDKLLRPEHAKAVFESFYFITELSPVASYVVGGIQLLISIGFLVGYRKKITYTAVFLMHLVSTLSSYNQYIAPFESINLLFFAAWPMLAACLLLVVLKDQDTLFTVRG